MVGGSGMSDDYLQESCSGMRLQRLISAAVLIATVAPWEAPASVSKPSRVDPPAGGAPVILAIQASGRLPGFASADVPRYLAGRMAAAHLTGWRFEPASPGVAPAPNRVAWEFRLHLRAAGGVRHHEREKQLSGTRRLIAIKARLFLNGEYQRASCGEAGIRGGFDDHDLAAAISQVTQSLLGGSGGRPYRSSRTPRPATPDPDPSNSGPPGQSTPPPKTGESKRSIERAVATGEWGGLRKRLEEQGVSIGAEWVMEGFANFRGGIDRGAVSASTFDADLSLDMQKLLGISGGELYIDLEDHAGRNPSAALPGDLQIFDKLNSTPYSQVFELWYQQRLFKDKLRIKAGKVDANTEFSVIDNGLSFINSSTQVTPTLFVFPTTPDPMPGINFFYTPRDLFYASFAVYDANRSDHFLNFTGHPEAIQPARQGKLLIGETGLIWKRLPKLLPDGNLRLGFWGHTGTFTRFDGHSQKGAQGLYLIFDQTLWKPTSEQTDERGLRMFLEYGHTDRALTPIYRHFGGGFAWKGLLPGRRRDMAGFSPQYARFSPEAGLPRDYELTLETFYRVQFTPWASFQSDLQHIVHPGGKYPSALVGTLRLKVIF